MASQSSVERFYRNIHCLRLSLGMSQARMAEILGVSVGTLRKMERGLRTPRISTAILWRASSAFKISLDILLKVDFQPPANAKTPPF